jgi:uncharacterized membrane protein
MAVNDAGVVAGVAFSGSGARAASWGVDGRRRDVGVPGAYSEAFDINAEGTIVGYAYGEGPNRAFVAKPGAPVEVLADPCTLPGASGALAAGLNDRGTIVGTCFEGDSTVKAIAWDGRTHEPSVLPGSRTSYDIQDINERGTIVGSTVGDTGYQAVTFVGPRHRELDVPPSNVHSLGRDINDLGVVVGVHYLAGEAYAWAPRTGTRVLGGIEGWNEALSVNNRGTIVGYTNTVLGAQRATMFTTR